MLSIRILVGGYFAWEAADKIRRFDEWVGYVGDSGMPFATAQMVLVVFLLVGGTTLVLLGRWAKVGALMLATFLAPTMLLFMAPPDRAQVLPWAVMLGVILWKGGGPTVWPKREVSDGS